MACDSVHDRKMWPMNYENWIPRIPLKVINSNVKEEVSCLSFGMYKPKFTLYLRCHFEMPISMPKFELLIKNELAADLFLSF